MRIDYMKIKKMRKQKAIFVISMSDVIFTAMKTLEC